MVEEAVEQLLRAATFSAHEVICNVVYYAVEQEALNQIRTDLLGTTIIQHVDQYFEAGKPDEPLGKR